MPNKVLVEVGTQIQFLVSGSISPVSSKSDFRVGTPTPVIEPLTLAGVLNTEGRHSNKVDLGAQRAHVYELIGVVDFSGETMSAEGRIDYYWMASPKSADGEGNIAGTTGLDADAPGTPIGGITLDEFKDQCDFIGSLRTTADANVQCGFVGTFSPSSRYGQLLVINNSGHTFEADDVEMHQVMNPIETEIQ